ncbi:YoaK family protein [Mesorhizobium sp. LNHC232B00]|uniref:YoaK family protein n=1 Tax=Mesorhizobium sp. LNHC232B00 TaxID=1287243 RepID=UPI00041DF592|nr:YoaK family protein [Mesorhizobium sp. LNHC232B00]
MKTTHAFTPGPGLPVTLAFVAGYVDAFTFLAFAGFFVAQATGSFVVAGSELVDPSAGVGLKTLAIPVFVLAGMIVTGVVRKVAGEGHWALVVALVLEALLLTGLAATALFGDPKNLGVAPALLGLAAMGIQSAAARLLLSGYGSTNVMTSNTTQLSIDLADSLLTGRVPPRLLQTAAIMLGFLLGVATGAVVFRAVGLGGLGLAIAIILGAALVTARSACVDRKL